jgi:hypothetical protein
VKLIPSSKPSLDFQNIAIAMPRIIAMIGPPIKGNKLPIMNEGIARIRQMIMP